MVKNTHGGSKAKSQARKFADNNNHTPHIILPTDPLHVLVFVEKNCGNLFKVIDHLGRNLNCFTRGKHKGRSKKQFVLSVNSFALAALRDWETNPTNCDLLFVYQPQHLHTLSSLPSFLSLSQHLPNQPNSNNDLFLSNYNTPIELPNNYSTTHHLHDDEHILDI